MPLSYILSQAGAKMGLNPTQANDRRVLLRFANEAARELYMQCDMPGSLMEQVFKVNGDQTITMPSYVGRVRAIREYASMQSWHINQMRPRYNQFNWTDMWRNFRLKNKQALMTSVSNQSYGIVVIPLIETPPIVVSLSGPTDNASLINEQIVMDSSSLVAPNGTYYKQSQNVFMDYVAVKKDRVNNYDVVLTDVNGVQLTVIPNNQKEAQYQILDVSACPWLAQNTSPLDNYVEILYKKALNYLFNDDDEFPAFDYDDIVVNKIMQLWSEEQALIDKAQAYDAKATRTTARLVEEQNRSTEDTVALVANPHDTMLKRIGTGLRRRYSLYAGRKY